MKKLYIFLYYSIAKQLPSSFYPLGEYFNLFRVFCIRKFSRVGKKTKIQKGVYLGNGDNIKIGNQCQVNEFVKLDNVILSDYVMIAPGVTILGKMHDYSDKSIPMILQGERSVQQTVIEKDVWIGTNAIIMPGLKLAEGCIIGAGSVVTKNTEPYGIYGGVPAKLIKWRN